MLQLVAEPTGTNGDIAEDDFCHLADESDPTQSACGSGVRHHHEGGPFSYEPGMTHCPGCGRPVCPDCELVFDIFRQTGEWEGV